jgi:hypothetical protein
MVDLNQHLSKNFQLWEFVNSPTATNLGIANLPNQAEIDSLKLLCTQILQPAREALGPLKVNSGFRSAALNTAVGGSKTSDHRKGFAADIVPADGDTLKLLNWAVKNLKKYDQIISEFGTDEKPDWIHLSANTRNRKQVLRATLQGKKTVYSAIDVKKLPSGPAPAAPPATPPVTPVTPSSSAVFKTGSKEAGVKWIKDTFGARISTAIKPTPFSLDLVCAIALQETFYIWNQFYTDPNLTEEQKLKLCVGDTLDAPNRGAFPVTRGALETNASGRQMFQVARRALESLAPYSATYKSVAAKNPNKFCHGFGIFQYDLQHYKTDPDYFLQERWSFFAECLAKLVSELNDALKRAYGPGKKTLTGEEMIYVAIAYNRGSVDFSRGFKQGFRDDSGKFYGEYMRDFLTLAQGVS